jgi:hypothetical protein
MFDISCTQGLAGFYRCGGDQCIRHLNSVRQSMLFEQCGRVGSDRFGKRQNSEPERHERLPNCTSFEPGTCALQEFHERDDGQCAICGRINYAAGRWITTGAPIKKSVSKIISAVCGQVASLFLTQ